MKPIFESEIGGWQRALVCALCIVPFAVGSGFPLDDAYITLHNARSVLSGSDALYGTSPLVGATSSLHLALLVAFGKVLPLPAASWALCCLGALAYGASLDALLRRAGAYGWSLTALVATGLLVGTVPQQLYNGLETSWAMATVCGLLLLADSRGLAVLAGVAPFIRPELAALAAPLLLRQFHTKSMSECLKTAGLAAASAAPFVLWLYMSTGAIFPNTSSAKVAFFAEVSWTVREKISAAAHAVIYNGFPVLLFGLPPLLRTPAGRPAAIYIVTVILAALLVLPGSLAWNHGRYLAPLVPCLLYGIASAHKQRPRSAVTAVLAVSSVLSAPFAWSQLSTDRQATSKDLAVLSTMVRSIPRGSVVLVHDAGMVAWIAAPVRLVDVVGLKSPKSTAAHETLTRHECMWGPALSRIAQHANAQYLIALREGFWHCVATNLQTEDWTLQPTGPSGRYVLYRLSRP